MKTYLHRVAMFLSVVLMLTITVFESWPASGANLCSIRLSQEDAIEYFKQSTTAAQRDLYDLVGRGDSSAVLTAISQAGNLNLRVPGNTWLISFAVQTLNVEIVGALLNAGADSNRRHCEGWPPLMYLAFPRSPDHQKNPSSAEIAQLLILHGAIIDGKSNDRWRRHLIGLAASNDDIVLLEWLKRRGANMNDEDMGSSPLTQAVEQNHSDATKWLLDNGAGPNGTNPVSQTPLMLAIDGGNFDIVKTERS
jgi:ankyrin repeat protein